MKVGRAFSLFFSDGFRVWNACGVGGVAAALLASLAQSAEITFHCPFDGGGDAAFAAGLGAAVYKAQSFVPGRKGQALRVSDAAGLARFDAAGNLPADRGAVELWIRGDWDGSDKGWRTFVYQSDEGAPDNGAIWFWKYENTIRFDVRHSGIGYVTWPIRGWKAGEWHHLLACYDRSAGIRLYVDGQRVAAKEGKWTPATHGAFYVGARDSGRYAAGAAIDELRIYGAPLSDAEAAQAFQGKLEVGRARARPRATAERVAGDGAPARLMFHLPFDGTPEAAHATGDKTARRPSGVTFVPGMSGEAARFGAGAKVSYGAKGNLRKERGTICFWYRPDFKPGDKKDRCLFRENGPRDAGSNAMWFWLWGLNNTVRFDLREPGDNYAVRGIADWEPGDWHFLAVTWDCGKGRTLFVDGAPVRGGGDSKTGLEAHRWEPKEHEEFFVGWDGGRTFAEGAIDEFKIFDGPLGEEEIAREYARRFPVVPEPLQVYFLQGRKAKFEWCLRNVSAGEAKGSLSWSLEDAKGQRLAGEGFRPICLPAGQRERIGAEVLPTAAGALRLTCAWEDARGGSRYQRGLSCWVVPQEEMRRTGELETRLVEEINCTKAMPPEKFVDGGSSRIVAGARGSYREAGGKRHSRFAYRILTPKVGAPHLLSWDYPDDKARTMEVILQVAGDNGRMYDLQTGVFCGDEYPVSGELLTHEAVFWPRQEDQALVFMTAEEDRPAAVAKIRVREIVGGLPVLPVRSPAPIDGWERIVGIYYEDPVLASNFGGDGAMPGFGTAVDRLLDYMDYSGQNALMYPAVWYRGPLFPSAAEPGMDGSHGRPHPFNYIEYLCRRMGQRGMYFIPTLNVHSLPSLVERATIDEAQIRAGAETPVMMMWDNRPKTAGWHGTPPNFNPLDPGTQAQFLRLVDEMVGLYGDLPAFKGICLHLTLHSILWFGSLDAGYNDTNIEGFQRETGLRIPVDATDPLRFNRRYRWLMANAREPWIEWRCRKIHDYYARMAARLAAKRPDLRLILNLYIPSSPDEKEEMFASVAGADPFAEINRRAGVDIGMYRGDRNIVIQRTLFPADYRWTRVHRDVGPDIAYARQINFAETGFAPLRACPATWINQHDRYWEDAIGREKPMSGLWGGELGWRVSTLNPNANHCMETYAWPLAATDSLAFTKGGFVIGTIGMEKRLGEFARAFRALPPTRFEDVPGLSDPVSVRQWRDGARLFFYLVNRMSWPAEVRLAVSGSPGRIECLRGGETSGGMTFLVPPYGLESFVSNSKDLRILGGAVKTPPAAVDALKARFVELEREAKQRGDGGRTAADWSAYFAEARDLLHRGAYGQLHFLLEDARAKTLDMAR